jgi:hypothetical protein
MASTYTPLGIEKQATGENAGTWGTKTNTNLEIVEQAIGGTASQAVSDSGDTTLSVSDGSTGATLAHRVIEFTGTLTASRNVTIPLDVQQLYLLKNGTSGSQNVVLKYVSGTGTSATVANGKTILAYAKADDGTNPNIVSVEFGGDVVDDTSPQLGGDLDVNGNDIVSTSNADIDIIPNGTGDVVLAADTVKVGDSGAAATLTSNGAGALTVTTGGAADLVLNTNSGTNAGTVTLTDAANGDITIAPNGTGRTKVTNASPGTSSTQIVTTDGKGIVFSMVFGY